MAPLEGRPTPAFGHVHRSDLHDCFLRLRQDSQSATATDLPLIGHDLAVIGLERFARNPSLVGELTQALNNWQQTLQSADFWRLMESRAEARGDVRLNARALEQIRDALPEHLLSRALSRRGRPGTDHTRRLLEAVKTSTASDAMKARATSYLAGETKASYGRRLRRFGKQSGASPKIKVPTERLERRSTTHWQFPHERGFPA